MSTEDRIREARLTAEREAALENPRRKRDVYRDRTIEYLRKREEFEARWKAIHEEGGREGYLVWSGGYEGEWEVDTSTDYKDGEEWNESVEEWQARVKRAAQRKFDAMVSRGLK